MTEAVVTKHSITVDRAEDGEGYVWKCVCGQASGPWSKKVAEQQHRKHLEEWAAYNKNIVKAKTTCAMCNRPLAAKSTVELDGKHYHKNCVKKVLDDA